MVAAVAIAFGPVFASNIVFATRFDTTEDATGAFAANLLGAMVGGCLEYLALIVGYPALLGLAGLLYLAAFLLGPKVKGPMPRIGVRRLADRGRGGPRSIQVSGRASGVKPSRA